MWCISRHSQVSSTWGLSRSFLGFIVLPIAGNACEHITAVFVAAKNKMDLSLGVAIGSSVQVRVAARMGDRRAAAVQIQRCVVLAATHLAGAVCCRECQPGPTRAC
jgi:hypothetical protein